MSEIRDMDGLPPGEGERIWKVTFSDPSGQGGRGRKGRRPQGLKPRPRQARAARESMLFDYQGREKSGPYAALVPVVAGYLIPGVILVLVLYGLLFGALGVSAALFPESLARAFSQLPDLQDFASMPDAFSSMDLNGLIEELLPVLAVVMLATFALAIPFLLLFTRHGERRPFRSLGFRGKAMGCKFGLGLLAGALAAAIPFFAGAVITRSPLSFNSQINASWLWPQLLAFGFFCVQGSFEELFFRGWSFTTLGKRFGRWRAVLVSSLVFASLHFMLTADSLLTMVNAFSLGVLFCVISMVTGDIALACGFHAMWNYLQITLLSGVGDGGWFVSPVDMESSGAYTLVIIAWTALLALVAALMYRRRVKRDGANGFARTQALAAGANDNVYTGAEDSGRV